MRVVLLSNACLQNYPNNTLTKFTIQLAQPLDLSEGHWEFGLSEIQFYKSWYNVKDAKLMISRKNEVSEVSIEDGFYESPEFLVQCLNESLEKTCNDDTKQHIKFNYNKIKRSCELHVTPHKGFSFQFTPNLEHLLGYNTHAINEDILLNSEKYPTRGDTIVPKIIVSGTASMRLNTIFNLMVYCDLAQSTIVGDTEAPLLRLVPITGRQGRHWENQSTTFSKIQYIPVSKKSVRSISVYIYTDFGQPVPFTEGRTTVTLEFRRALSTRI